jgi:hypothetical protein
MACEKACRGNGDGNSEKGACTNPTPGMVPDLCNFPTISSCQKQSVSTVQECEWQIITMSIVYENSTDDGNIRAGIRGTTI